MIKLLLVENDPNLRYVVQCGLVDIIGGYDVQTATNGEEGLQVWAAFKPDIIISDIDMPVMDGFEMVRRIRKTDTRTPVLFLTARSAMNDVVEGFEIGGNDYLKKPFGMQELMVRIKALLGRAARQTPEDKTTDMTTFEIGDYRFDATAQRLAYNGRETELSHRESEILRRLCEHKDNVTDMRQMLLDLWGDDSFFNQRSLHVFITKLRHKLAKDERIRIVNVRGIGYKLIVDTATLNG